MKYLLSIVFFFTIFNFAFSESITPPLTNEFCPNTEYTFTVTIPKTYQSIINVGASAVTQLPQVPVGSTFNFKGKFGDANEKQTFRVHYTDGTFYDFDFKKIKSLFYATNCTQIQPNQSTVIAPRCQATNITITFNNIPWGTNYENPAFCFGAVTNYEYQLPANWKVGTTFTSNGSNWYSGTNNVTVTSDLSTGDKGSIYIRPANTACGAGLKPGGSAQTVSIAVSRPAPTMSITPTGSAAYICKGTSKPFTLVGLPANATVTSWVSGDPNQSTVPPNSTGTSVVVTNVIGDGVITLTANVAQCSYTYAVPVTVTLGTYVQAVYSVTANSISSTNNQYSYFTNPPPPYYEGYANLHANEQVFFYSTINSSQITNPTWSVTGTYNLFSSTANTFSLHMQAPGSGTYSRNAATVKLTAGSACGAVNKSYTLYAILANTSFRITASPNPVKGNIQLSITNTTDTKRLSEKLSQTPVPLVSPTGKTRMYLYNFNSNTLVKEWSYPETDAKNYKLNILGVKPGWYILKVERDGQAVTTKLFVQ